MRPGEPDSRTAAELGWPRVDRAAAGGYFQPMPARFELPEDHPNVALVTIDRAERANALDPRTLCDLAEAWRRIAADPEIRCAVLTGAGSRVFCSGMRSSGVTMLASRSSIARTFSAPPPAYQLA